MAPMPEEAPVTRAVPWVWTEFMTVLLDRRGSKKKRLPTFKMLQSAIDLLYA
jgi:hypothetical protein